MSLDQAKAVVNRIQQSQGNFKRPAKSVEDNNHPRVQKTMSELFTRLKAITAVGNAFNADSEHIVKQEWVLAFALEGIKSQEIIDRGVEAMRAKSRKSRGTTWFPSIGEFVDACLGSDDKLERAKNALRIFNNPKWMEKQICNIGQMVVSNHSFEIKDLKARDGDKLFLELYLKYAADNEFKLLDAFAITETVQLSPEQQKDADKRALVAQNENLSKLRSMFGKPVEKVVTKPVKKEAGLVMGKIKGKPTKTVKQLEAEKARQLAAIKDRL